MVIKVADFGLAVNTGDKDYYRLTTNMGVKLPVMWMAPESLSNRVFSEMSDVVSSLTCSNNYCNRKICYFFIDHGCHVIQNATMHADWVLSL